MLSRVELEKSFITSGPGLLVMDSVVGVGVNIPQNPVSITLGVMKCVFV